MTRIADRRRNPPPTGPAAFPAVVLIDQREKLPYRFDAVPADVGQGGGLLAVTTSVETLPSGDYSLDGWRTEVAVERKSACDLFGTLGGGRDRFVRELERLASYRFAAVVVEAEWSDVFNDPPRHTQLSPKSVYRSVLAWSVRYPARWFFVPGRAVAEVTTFRLLQRFWMEQEKK